MTVGIASLGLHFPSLVLDVRELAKLRNVDPNKYVVGLGCDKIAICPKDYSIADLLTKAAERALSNWPGNPDQIGMIAVGTESANDISRPLSAWVADKLNLKGAIRSYEVKHACYGGTLALLQGVEWKLSGNSKGKAALVVAGDIAQYAVNDPGEPTQGAGAVAMIIDEPLIASIDPTTHTWSEPAFDFWHPNNVPYPIVDGPFSLECYQRGAMNCFRQLIGDNDPEEVLNQFALHCFHVPFPKMVKKAVMAVGQYLKWDEAKIEKFYQQKVEPTMVWNHQSGNSYTGSLWVSVAYTLTQLKVNQKITAFSYGSGFGTELLTITVGSEASKKTWVSAVEEDFASRREISAEEYARMRA